jgi:filamentous hemagglutinin family protein
MSAGSASANFGALRSKSIMLRGVSLAALAMLIPLAPAHAQLAARRGAVVTAPVVTPIAAPRAILSPQMSAALEGSVAGQSRADGIRAYVTQARTAALANVRALPTNGLTPNGLVVATGVTSSALAAGALQAARDATGRATWQGAALPVETTGSDGKSLVTITQNESRAILSWNRFDVGSNTIVQFDQKVGGVGQQNWIALNRVVGPTAPSTILGSIKADGTVVVLNQRGVVFGNGAQVDLHSSGDWQFWQGRTSDYRRLPKIYRPDTARAKSSIR